MPTTAKQSWIATRQRGHRERTHHATTGLVCAGAAKPANGGTDTGRQPSHAKRVAPQQLTGAQAVVRSLEELGVDVIFGIPGGAVLPVYDPLFDSHKLRHVLVRHEQGAGHAASGYAHATGKRRRLHGHLGPRRHQPGHPAGRRADGLHPGRRDHRTGRAGR